MLATINDSFVVADDLAVDEAESSLDSPKLQLQDRRAALEAEGNVILLSDNIEPFRLTPLSDLRNLYIEHEGDLYKAEDIIYNHMVIDDSELYRATIKRMHASVLDLAGCRFSDNFEKDQLIKENFVAKWDRSRSEYPDFEKMMFSQTGKCAIVENSAVTFRADSYLVKENIEPQLRTYSEFKAVEDGLIMANPELRAIVYRAIEIAATLKLPQDLSALSEETTKALDVELDKLWGAYLRGDFRRGSSVTEEVIHQVKSELNARSGSERRAKGEQLFKSFLIS